VRKTSKNPSIKKGSKAMKKIYLAGPMTGYDELNFPLFHAETARLRALGYEVVNPAEINPEVPDRPDVFWSEAQWMAYWVACMRADIKQLVDCDAVALLPGWQQSRGAKLEHMIATSLGFVCTSAADISEPA
jgi:hypothetical protein